MVNFSYGTTTTSTGAPERRYLVLFFDDSTMELADQVRAREAAQKFIDADAGPDRVMAVVDFTGALRVIQNFTTDAVRLKEAAKNMKPSAVAPNGESSLTNTSLPMSTTDAAALQSESDFGIHTLLLGIRSLAKNLTNVPGRKSVVLFTAGFPLTAEAEAELTATISACNQANVAIYPLDVRGLIATMPSGPATQLRRGQGSTARLQAVSHGTVGDLAAAKPHLVLASYPIPAAAAEPPIPRSAAEAVVEATAAEEAVGLAVVEAQAAVEVTAVRPAVVPLAAVHPARPVAVEAVRPVVAAACL